MKLGDKVWVFDWNGSIVQVEIIQTKGTRMRVRLGNKNNIFCGANFLSKTRKEAEGKLSVQKVLEL